MLYQRLGPWVGVALMLSACASGDAATSGGTGEAGGSAGSSGSSGAGGTAGTAGSSGSSGSSGSAGSAATGGTAGSAGSSGSAGAGGSSGSGGTAGNGGTAGAGGTAVTGDVALCVLNEKPPQGACDAAGTLDYGLISGGTMPMRLFRVDNPSTGTAKFTAVATADQNLSIKAVRYEVDPGDPNNLLRIESTLPVNRDPGASLYFEVTFVGPGSPGQLPNDPVIVTYDLGALSGATINVPVTGEISACPSGTEACDADPNNGCETNILTSNEHCGACNSPCAPANGTGQCVQGVCTITNCTTPFADCDGLINNGCEANLLTTVETCGQCDISCVKAATTPVCVGGLCDVSTCADGFADCNLDVNGYDGCETSVTDNVDNCGQCNISCDQAHMTGESCVNKLCVPGTCDSGWMDCNGQTADGCEADINNDAAHCGGCLPANNCFFAHAGASCNQGTCQIGTCNINYDDCNGLPNDGCETSLQTDKLNCGACDNNCNTVFANSNTTCGAGICAFTSCKTGYIDLNNNTVDGCEYQCTPQGGTDSPDDSFVDSNCDGIDGDANAAIFVATGGNDGNPGTKAQPVATVNAGIAKALAAGKTQVYVSEGTYTGQVSLGNGISIYGGYSAANNWARSAAYTTKITTSAESGGRVTALDGANITTATTVDRVTITTGAATTPGTSNYAVYCTNCTALTLKNDVITAGAGAAGVAGVSGSAGSVGGDGQGGGGGSCDGSGGGTGGPAGSSACGRSGGNGGVGGQYGPNNGATGGSGVGGTAGGIGGSYGNPGQPGANGTNGNAGAVGTSGNGGSGGTVTGGFWTSSSGQVGGAGNPGNGGGGGGGGGGQQCTICVRGPGNGGGGGGAGGCGGTAGSGGTGGGGSFGLFLYNSNGASLVNNTITSGSGGAGGAGAGGGTGGSGGNGAGGAQVCTGEVGGGGSGGNGGKGGNGGPGGGGAGGPSYAVYRLNSTVSVAGNTLTPGSGGLGGSSPGNPGATGASGTVF